MTVIVVEGFDAIANARDLNEKGWAGSIFNTVQGRWPDLRNRGVTVVLFNAIVKPLPGGPYHGDLIVGAAMKVNAGSHTAGMILTNPGDTDVVQVGWDDLLRPIITGFGPTLTGTQIITTETWHYYELKITAAGHVSLNINGGPEIADTAGYNVSDGFDRLKLDSNALFPVDARATEFDDVYVATIDSDTPDFLGDVYVQTLYPNGEGDYLEWTPDVGTVHYTRVNEHQPDGDASVVKSNTPNARDIYNFEDLPPLTPVVYAAQLNLVVRKNNVATREIKPMIRQDGTDYLGPSDFLPSSYDVHQWLLSNDPTGADWDVGHINNDQYGIKLIT